MGPASFDVDTVNNSSKLHLIIHIYNMARERRQMTPFAGVCDSQGVPQARGGHSAITHCGPAFQVWVHRSASEEGRFLS